MLKATHCLLAISLFVATTSVASDQTVPLTIAPGSDIQTTIEIVTAFGADSDGPKPVAVTGTADARITTSIDPAHGLVATSLQFTASALDFADTDFLVTVFIPITISLVGIEGVFSTDVLAPGLAIAPGTAEFDEPPLSIEWTAGEIVVDAPPGTPAAGVVYDLVDTAEVVTTANGSSIDVMVTVPVSAVDVVEEAGITVITTISGGIVLTGSYPTPSVPALGAGSRFGLALLFVALGVAPLRRRRLPRAGRRR